MEDIGQSLRGLTSRGFGINNVGVVVGDSVFIAASTADSPIRHAALFSNGSVIDLGTLKKQTFSRANSINGFNQVVGFSGPALDSPKSRAFFWSKSTGMVDLGTLVVLTPRRLRLIIPVSLPATRNFVRALSTPKLYTRSFPHHPREQERWGCATSARCVAVLNDITFETDIRGTAAPELRAGDVVRVTVNGHFTLRGRFQVH